MNSNQSGIVLSSILIYVNEGRSLFTALFLVKRMVLNWNFFISAKGVLYLEVFWHCFFNKLAQWTSWASNVLGFSISQTAPNGLVGLQMY